MKNVFLQLSIIGILFIFVPTGMKANTAPDSIHTLKHVMKIHVAVPDSALKLLDVMENRKLEKTCLINAQRSLSYSQKRQPQMSVNYALKALQDTALRSERLYYLQTMSCIAAAYQRLANYEQSIHYLTEGIQFSREIGHKQTEADFLFTMGENYYALNQRQEAYDCFEQAIQLLENEKEFRMKPTLSYFYGQLTNYLAGEQKYNEAIAFSNKREAVLTQMKKQKGIPQGYIDQQLSYLYIKQAYLYAQLGILQKASTHFEKFSATRYSKHKAAHIDITAYRLAMKQYKQIIDYYQKTDLTELTADTISQEFIGILSNLSEAHRGMNDFQKVLQYQQRMQVIEDSLNARNWKNEVAELATIYKLQEKEWHIRQKDEQLRNSFIIQTLLGCAFALALVLLWLAVRHINTIKKKNQLIAGKLDSLMSYEEELEKLHRQIDESKISVAEEQEREDSINKDLFRKMERIIKDEKLYLMPELVRQDMLARLSVDKNRFAQMLQENTNMTFSQYLTDLRLKHALTELKQHPNYTIQAIAEVSGFSNTRHFQRLFKAAYDMTPSEYKRHIQGKQPLEPPTD